MAWFWFRKSDPIFFSLEQYIQPWCILTWTDRRGCICHDLPKWTKGYATPYMNNNNINIRTLHKSHLPNQSRGAIFLKFCHRHDDFMGCRSRNKLTIFTAFAIEYCFLSLPLGTWEVPSDLVISFILFCIVEKWCHCFSRDFVSCRKFYPNFQSK